MSETSESEMLLDSISRDEPDEDKSPSNKPGASSSLPDDNQSNKNNVVPVGLTSAIAGEPHALYRLIREQAQIPPRILLYIRGYPFEGASTTVFHFCIDLTYTVLRANTEDHEWNEFKVVRDGDGIGAHRGGWSPTLEWKPARRFFGSSHKKKNPKSAEGELEGQSLLGINENTSDGADLALMTWGERFCRDPAGIKKFRLDRSLQGFDSKALESEVYQCLRAIVRDDPKVKWLNVSCNINLSPFDVRSPHWFNALDDNIWFGFFIILTQLWIIFLPIMCFLRGRYEVANSIWKASKAVRDEERPCGLAKIHAHGRNESKLTAFWAPAIAQAIKDRENTCRVLKLTYLEDLEERNRDRATYAPLSTMARAE
ncbi:hypothetical protein N7456_005664 [Penicillium angulare]|uniref:Uncharacterized protein n=1 Tax=Penicillium angulare TaxID=116970 RepID=A0A9W9KJJ7_9EURO|nr:hypothetical protein N7456_005664 [Penicillium angulare]